MRSRHASRLIIATAIVSLLSIACFIVGYFFNYWWVIEQDGIKTTEGLWRKCVDYGNGTETCEDRTILTFSAKRGTDPIITCFIISVGFSIFVLFSSLSIIICCRKKPTTWYKTVQWMTFFVIISFVAAADAMLYTEFEFKDALSNGTRGWAYMVSMAGTGFQLILFVLIIAQLCVKPLNVVDTTPW